MSGKDLIRNAVSLPESTQYSFSEVGGRDILDRTINHTSKYPHDPGGEREKEGGRERIDNIVLKEQQRHGLTC